MRITNGSTSNGRGGMSCIVLPYWLIRNRKDRTVRNTSEITVQKRKFFHWLKSIRIRNSFLADTKSRTGSGVSCIARGVRAECGRTSPFPISEMWDHLVQWSWFFASCVQDADRIFFYETCGRAENKRRTLHPVWTQQCNMTKTLRRKTIMKKRALILAMIAFIAATTSEPSINMVRAEETQVEETQTEESFLSHFWKCVIHL